MSSSSQTLVRAFDRRHAAWNLADDQMIWGTGETAGPLSAQATSESFA